MIEVTKKIKWIPGFGLQRELDWLKNMNDWLISKKNRYWGLALPIYECKKCNYFNVIGSKDELKEKTISGWNKFKGNSPHRPWIDEVKIKCPKCKEPLSRIKDVGNPWLDAGIVAYSTLIDPKTKKVSYLDDKKYWSKWFPADFITESFPGQFKNWFYSLIAMSSVLEQKPPFKTVLGYASVVGEDGRPMHKSWGNSIEFNEGADKFGVDVMRWMYVRQDPTKNLLFGPIKANEVKRLFHIRLWNTLKYFITYSNIDNWKRPSNFSSSDLNKLSLTLLDKWILSEYTSTLRLVKNSLQNYNSEKAAKAIEAFVDKISLWYLRLSRERVWNNSKNKQDKIAFYSTFYYLISNLVIMLSVFLPFFSEEIYAILEGEKESVHLENWPKLNNVWLNTDLNKQMSLIRNLAEIGHSNRKLNNIKVRQPLAKATFFISAKSLKIIKNNKQALSTLLTQELNVKKIELVLAKNKTALPYVKLETSLTTELEWEGKIREYIRKIQRLRQKQECEIDEKVEIVMPEVPKQYLNIIKEKVLAKNIKFTKEPEIKVLRAK